MWLPGCILGKEEGELLFVDVNRDLKPGIAPFTLIQFKVTWPTSPFESKDDWGDRPPRFGARFPPDDSPEHPENNYNRSNNTIISFYSN